MSYLKTVSPENATGVVAEVYKEVSELFGFIPNAIQQDSVSPEHLQFHWSNIKAAVMHPSLSGVLLACIRLLMSEPHNCTYCIDLNTAILINDMGLTADQVAALRADPSSAPLNEKELALFLYTLRACADSNSVNATDVQALRDVGASDKEIYDALTHGAQQISGDIMINAFGVEAD